MTKKEKSAVEEYMARTDLPDALKSANRGFVGVPDDFASAIEENAGKAAPLAAELAKWQALAESTWEAPTGLSEAAAKLEQDYPATVSLARAVDLMAFGSEPALDESTDRGKLEAGALRRRAFAALRDAAHQGKFPMEHGADATPIKPGQFSFVQGLGDNADSIEFGDAKEGKPDKHLQLVQIVDASKFYGWLRGGHSAREVTSPKSRVAPIPDGARIIPNQPFDKTTLECVRLALLETPPFDKGFVTLDWTWADIANAVQEPYKRQMKKRHRNENAAPSVSSVRRVFGEA